MMIVDLVVFLRHYLLVSLQMNQDMWERVLECLTVREQLGCIPISKTVQAAACSRIAATRMIKWNIRKYEKANTFRFDEATHLSPDASLTRVELAQIGYPIPMHPNVFLSDDEKSLELGKYDTGKEMSWNLVYRPACNPQMNTMSRLLHGFRMHDSTIQFAWQSRRFETFLTDGHRQIAAQLSPSRLAGIVSLMTLWLQYCEALSRYRECDLCEHTHPPSKQTQRAQMIRWVWILLTLGGWAWILDDSDRRNVSLLWRIWAIALCAGEFFTQDVHPSRALRLLRNQHGLKWRFPDLPFAFFRFVSFGHVLLSELLRPTFLCYTTALWIYAGWPRTLWMVTISLGFYLSRAILFFMFRLFRPLWLQGFIWTIALGQPPQTSVDRGRSEKEWGPLAIHTVLYLSIVIHLWQSEIWTRLYTLFPWLVLVGSCLGFIAWRAIWIDPESRGFLVASVCVIIPHLISCNLWLMEFSYVSIWACNVVSFIAFLGWLVLET